MAKKWKFNKTKENIKSGGLSADDEERLARYERIISKKREEASSHYTSGCHFLKPSEFDPKMVRVYIKNLENLKVEEITKIKILTSEQKKKRAASRSDVSSGLPGVTKLNYSMGNLKNLRDRRMKTHDDKIKKEAQRMQTEVGSSGSGSSTGLSTAARRKKKKIRRKPPSDTKRSVLRNGSSQLTVCGSRSTGLSGRAIARTTSHTPRSRIRKNKEGMRGEGGGGDFGR